MSLVHCRECSGQVSTEAGACPHCGAPVAVANGVAPVAGGGCCLGCGCLKLFLLAWLAFLFLCSLPFWLPQLAGVRQALQEGVKKIQTATPQDFEKTLQEVMLKVQAEVMKKYLETLKRQGRQPGTPIPGAPGGSLAGMLAALDLEKAEPTPAEIAPYQATLRDLEARFPGETENSVVNSLIDAWNQHRNQGGRPLRLLDLARLTTESADGDTPLEQTVAKALARAPK